MNGTERDGWIDRQIYKMGEKMVYSPHIHIYMYNIVQHTWVPPAIPCFPCFISAWWSIWRSHRPPILQRFHESFQALRALGGSWRLDTDGYRSEAVGVSLIGRHRIFMNSPSVVFPFVSLHYDNPMPLHSTSMLHLV